MAQNKGIFALCRVIRVAKNMFFYHVIFLIKNMFFIVFFFGWVEKNVLGIIYDYLNVSRLFGGLVNKVSAKSNKYFQIYTQKCFKPGLRKISRKKSKNFFQQYRCSKWLNI